MDLTIAGRYMVYAPFGEGVGVSRRLDDAERDRLRKEAAKLDLQGRGGDHPHRRPGRQARRSRARAACTCSSSTRCCQKRVEETPAPALVFQEADLSVRVVRDIYSSAFERAIVDDAKQHHRLVSFFSRTAPDLVDQVELWEERAAAVRRLRGRGGARLDAVAPGRPAQRRLSDDRLRRGADRHRRQLGLVHRPRQGRAAGGHDHQDQPRGRRRGRAPAAAARHRRDHRHRLHRHGAGPQPRCRVEDPAQGPGRGPHEDLRGRDLAAGPGRDDAPERHRRRARDHDPAVPDLRRRGRDQVRGDDRDRVRAPHARPGHRGPRPRRC